MSVRSGVARRRMCFDHLPAGICPDAFGERSGADGPAHARRVKAARPRAPGSPPRRSRLARLFLGMRLRHRGRLGGLAPPASTVAQDLDAFWRQRRQQAGETGAGAGLLRHALSMPLPGVGRHRHGIRQHGRDLRHHALAVHARGCRERQGAPAPAAAAGAASAARDHSLKA